MYDRVVRRLRDVGRLDGEHAASWVAMEFQAAAALLLLVLLFVRLTSLQCLQAVSGVSAAHMFSWVLGLAALAAAAYLTRGVDFTGAVLGENDGGIQTLLYHMVASLAAMMLYMGVSMWV